VASERPKLHCLIAFPSNGCHPTQVQLVELEEAHRAMLEGWWVVGPDPQDEAFFALWLDAQFPEDTGYHDE
jgi:hypothetical protein